jgi:hypothetical protein
MKKNPCLDAALRELAAAGIHDVVQAYGGKHLQVRWQVNGHPQRMFSLPLTPSDFRSAANTRSQIRNILKEDGISFEQHKAAPAPAPKLHHRVASLEGRVNVLEREHHELKTLLAKLTNNGGEQ